jgi:hypothetical protein
MSPVECLTTDGRGWARIRKTCPQAAQMPARFEFLRSVFGFPSDFEIRVSDLAPALPHGYM